jgi:hypothetical protein
LHRRLSTAARERIVTHYTWDRSGDALAAVCRELRSLATSS